MGYRIAAIVFGLVLAACDSLAGTNYEGEPIVRLSGTLNSTGSGSLPPLEIGLAWIDLDAVNEEAVPFVAMPVSHQPPGFTADVVGYPPMAAGRREVGGVVFLDHLVVVVARGSVEQQLTNELIGGDSRVRLRYIDAGASAHGVELPCGGAPYVLYHDDESMAVECPLDTEPASFTTRFHLELK